MPKTPSEHIDAQVDSGLQWLQTGIAVARGRSRDATVRALAAAADEAVFRAGAAYAALLGRIEVLTAEGRLDDADEERQLELPGTRPIERCYVRDDVCTRGHCDPDPWHPVCRSQCGVGPVPYVEPVPEDWRRYAALVCAESYDPETGEVYDADSVEWHRPAMLSASPSPSSSSSKDTVARSFSELVTADAAHPVAERKTAARAMARAARRRGAKPAAEQEPADLPWDVQPGDVVRLKDGYDALVVSLNGLGSGVTRIAMRRGKPGDGTEWDEEIFWYGPDDILEVIEVAK